jgi:hypothetical protein
MEKERLEILTTSLVKTAFNVNTLQSRNLAAFGLCQESQNDSVSSLDVHHEHRFRSSSS